MYTYVRIYNVMKKILEAENDDIDEDTVDFSILDNDIAFDIVKKIDEFEDTLLNVEHTLSPNILAKYLYSLSKLFNSYY